MSCSPRNGTAGENGTMKTALVVGNPKPMSRTYEAAQIVLDKLTGAKPDLSVDLVDFGPALLDWSDVRVAETIAAVQQSDLVVFASPTYKASYTGLLKLFLDRFGSGALTGRDGDPADARRPLASLARVRPAAEARARRTGSDVPHPRPLPARQRLHRVRRARRMAAGSAPPNRCTERGFAAVTYRPRGVCRVCRLPRLSSWSGDVLLLGRHRHGMKTCAGSGQPAAEMAARRLTGK